MKKLYLGISLLFFIFLIQAPKSFGYEMLVIDQNGKRVGYDSVTGSALEEIPQSVYGVDYSDNTGEEYKLLDVRAPESRNYVLYIIGKDTETYEVSMSNNNLANDIVVEGTVFPGQVVKYYTDISSGGVSIFKDNVPPVSRISISGASRDGVFYISTTNVCSIFADDPLLDGASSGVSYSEYAVDSGNWIVYSDSFSLAGYASGKHSFEYRSVDKAGNVEEIETFQFFVDTLAPVITIASPVSGERYFVGKSTLVVSYTVTDADPLPSQSCFLVREADDTRIPCVNGTAVDLATLGWGWWNAVVSVQDWSGNKSTAAAGPFEVVVDTTAPVTEISVENFVMTLTASDDISGVAKTLYRINKGSTLEYSEPVNMVSTATVSIAYYSKDCAGNIEQAKVYYIYKDSIAPSVAFAPVEAGSEFMDGAVICIDANAQFRLSAVDPEISGNCSGVKELSHNIDGGEWTTQNTAELVTAFPGLSEGIHAINYKAVDNGGNISAVGLYSAWFDTAKPLISGTYPADNGFYSVRKASGVRILFSEPVKCADWSLSVDVTDIRGRTPKRLSFAYDAAARELVISGKFMAHTKYTVAVKSGITDRVNKQLAPYSFTFMTLLLAREGGTILDDRTGVTITALPDGLPCDGYFDISLLEGIRMPKLIKPYFWLFNGRSAYHILYRDEQGLAVREPPKKPFKFAVSLRGKPGALAGALSPLSGAADSRISVKNTKLYQIGGIEEAEKLAQSRQATQAASGAPNVSGNETTLPVPRLVALQTADEPLQELSAELGSFGLFSIAGFTAPAVSLEDLSCYPNPFNPVKQTVTIQYYLKENSDTGIAIYDLMGNLVKAWKLVSGDPCAQAGLNQLIWDGRNGVGDRVANGGYIVFVHSAGEQKKFKIMVIK